MVKDHATGRLKSLHLVRRDAAGPDVGVMNMTTSRVFQLSSGDQVMVVIDVRVAPSAQRSPKPSAVMRRGSVRVPTVSNPPGPVPFASDRSGPCPDGGVLNVAEGRARSCGMKRVAMKPLSELLMTSLDDSAGLARKGRAYEYLAMGGDPALFDDQVVLRVVLPSWQQIGGPRWPIAYLMRQAAVVKQEDV